MQAPPMYPPCMLPPSFTAYRNFQQYRYSQCQWQNIHNQFNPHNQMKPVLPPSVPPLHPAHHYNNNNSSSNNQGKSGGKDGEEKKGEEWEQYNAGAAFLGPTLWDKTLSYDADLKLEYMDLDEFLNENGIPIEDSKRAGTNTTGGVNGSVGGLPSGTNSNLRAAQSPEAPSSPETSSPQMGSGMGACPQGAGVSSGLGAAPATSVGALSVAPPALSPQDYVGDCSSSVSSPGSPDPHSPLQVPEPESARASQGRDVAAIVAAAGRGLNEKFLGSASASSARATALPSAAAGDLKSEVRFDYHISPNDLALATVPGQDFDPRTRCFSEEELKPQPMIKKSRKQFVPPEMKDEKYWARRRKNNLAAKRSRDARRLKENQIAMRANYLEKENLALRIQVDKATKEVESLKTRLGKYEDVEVKTIITGIGKFEEDMKTNITEHTSSH
ncbi:hepatic leukemia factor-like isoform X12 [Macrobrachium rosenbergii]|uniref:hepatic leukemia factor-like isoform X12 n=1 Tax=Macrobrachium rosenbergii TaxID=79674 RepID=UPI0034D72348